MTLCVDIMYVNRVAMLVSISRSIKFGTIEAVPNNKSATIMSGVKAIRQIYQQNGFNVAVALIDGEFGHLWGELADMGIANIARRTRGGYRKIHSHSERANAGDL